jgi:hypothetical protein
MRVTGLQTAPMAGRHGFDGVSRTLRGCLKGSFDKKIGNRKEEKEKRKEKRVWNDGMLE